VLHVIANTKHADAACPQPVNRFAVLHAIMALQQGCQKPNPFADSAGIKISTHPYLQHYAVSASIA